VSTYCRVAPARISQIFVTKQVQSNDVAFTFTFATYVDRLRCTSSTICIMALDELVQPRIAQSPVKETKTKRARTVLKIRTTGRLHSYR
jgi:hypothetical protein